MAGWTLPPDDSARGAWLEFFFPSRCCFCRRLTRNGTPVCRPCGEKYPDLPRAQRERLLTDSLRCLSPLRYTGDARRALLRYKFSARTGYAPIFAELMRLSLDESGLACDRVTWVPLSAKRLRARGFDQARLLAEALAAGAGLPCAPLLEKIRHSPPQSSLRSRAQRRQNAAGAYRCLGAEMKGRHILLVDDIVTSGATLTECARMLRRAGAARVTAITAAAARDG